MGAVLFNTDAALSVSPLLLLREGAPGAGGQSDFVFRGGGAAWYRPMGTFSKKRPAPGACSANRQ